MDVQNVKWTLKLRRVPAGIFIGFGQEVFRNHFNFSRVVTDGTRFETGSCITVITICPLLLQYFDINPQSLNYYLNITLSKSTS